MARFDRQNRTVNEVMTHDPRTVGSDATLTEAAREMRDGDVGSILITNDRGLEAIITDRDIVVRAVAEGRDPGSTRVSELDLRPPITIAGDQPIDEAVRLMREHDVRRLAVTEGDRPIGILSIGDLAVELDPDSALADISAASPNN